MRTIKIKPKKVYSFARSKKGDKIYYLARLGKRVIARADTLEELKDKVGLKKLSLKKKNDDKTSNKGASTKKSKAKKKSS